MKVNITKESFCDLIDSMESYWRKLQKVGDVTGVDYSSSIFISLFDKVTDFLIEVFDLEKNDTYLADDINWYMFELDFGKEWRPGSLLIDERDIPCRNSEELWDIVTKEVYRREN